MRKLLFALLVAAPVLLGQTAGRQVQYSSRISTLTPPSGAPPENVGFGYLASSARVAADGLSNVYLAKDYTDAHNGVTHLVYRQRFDGIEVYNAAWVANIGPDGAVLSAGGTLYSVPTPVNFADRIPEATAVRAAVREVNPRVARTYTPSKISAEKREVSRRANAVQYAADGLGADIEGSLVWFAHRGVLLMAWVFNIVDEDGVSTYDVAVEAETGAIIDKRATTFFQAAPKGLVFDQGSPQPNPTPGVRLNSAPPLVDRNPMTLAGDPVASPQGWVLNNETAGYNVVAGENLFGLAFLTTATRTQAVQGGFNFPLTLGPSAPNPLNYRDAANVDLFYWANRAHDMHYAYGFNEAAGNFQSDNYGRGGVGGDALLAYSHYGAAAPVAPALNNAFFTTRSLQDGSPSMIAMYATVSGSAGFFSDGAYAADVITHEYTHGVSLRLLPDGYGTFQTAAMGEAWSDFFGLEYNVPAGAPVDGSYPVGEYWIQTWGTGIRTRPFSTNTGINPLTFAALGHVIPYPEVHADGEIWVEALWEARGNLIEQFGETEGRRRIRQLVIDGLKLSPPSPTMVDARDAILLADRVDFKGASQDQLWKAFAKRGLGALAHSEGGDTIHVIPSFDLPSVKAALKFYEDTFVAGEPVRVLLADANQFAPTLLVQLTTNSGDQEKLLLSRTGSIYEGIIPSSNAVVTPQNGVINLTPGDTITASYYDDNAGPYGPFFTPGGATVQATAATQQPYTQVTNISSTGLQPFPNETRLTNVRFPVSANIPFDFPFFGRKYRSMLILPTGIIEFEPSVLTNLSRPGCNDATELSQIAGIAPLFLNLTFNTTSQAAQPNEGLYASSSANSMNIRWAAETLTQLAPPQPVNFAATITAEGLITFSYGSGNQNLQTDVQTLSTCGSQPTVGISNGHDVYARTLTLASYTDAPSVALVPPFPAASTPAAILERPAPDETVRGVMRVSGIGYDTGAASLSFITRRDVFVDGIDRAIAQSVSRPDYCAANPVPGCPFVGFQTDVNLGPLNLASGPHTIFVRITNSRGVSTDSATVSFNVDAAPARLPKGAIEAPAAGAELSGTAVVKGFAYGDDFLVNRVDVLIDGVNYPLAIYGAPRPDICAPLAGPTTPPNCPNVGWTLTLNTRTGTPPLPDGPHSMQLRVLDQTGRYTLVGDPLPFTVKNGPQTFPTGAITSVQPSDRLSGIVPISGYAYSPVGRVVSVLVLVDGGAVGIAQYGQPRPDDCAALPSVSACPNIGFNFNFDSRTLDNGPHVIGVRITNDSGLGVTVPNLVANGMNVTVDNP